MLLEVIISQIKKFKPDANLTISSRDDSMLPKLDVNTVCFNEASKNKIIYFLQLITFLIKIYKKNDIIVFGGGTQIFDNSKYSWKPMFVTATVLLLNRVFLRRKIIHYGNGIGALDTYMGRLFTKCIGILSDSFILRDETSFNKAKDLGFSPKKLLLARDLAYSLNDPLFNQNVEACSFDSEITKIGFSLFEYYKYTKVDELKASVFKENIYLVLKTLLNDTNKEIYIFVFQEKYGNQDGELANEIKNQLGSHRITIVPYSNNWREVVSKMNQMDLCIGMRYHFLLTALKLRKKTIAINYSVKVESELRMFGISQNIIPLESFTSQTIEGLISSLSEDKGYITNIEEQFKLIENCLEVAEKKFQALICD